MRNYRHLSFPYAWSRLKEIIYQRRYKDFPWLTRDANMILAAYLTEHDVGLEFGGGRSTIWFAKRISKLVCVEASESWYAAILQRLEEENIKNVDCRRIGNFCNQNDVVPQSLSELYSEFGAEYFDFVLVDGVSRGLCAIGALTALKPGGILIIDNVNRYLPSHSKSPHSRTQAQGPDGAIWSDFMIQVKGWRCVWTSSGVTDTAIYFKPVK